MNRNVFATAMVAMMSVSISAMAQNNQRSTMDLPPPTVEVVVDPPVVAPAPAPAPVATEGQPTQVVAFADMQATDAPVVVMPQRIRGTVAPPAKHDHVFRAGFGASVGLPSGFGVGLVVNPWIDWARVELSLQNNVLSFGGRASLQIDPMTIKPRLPVGLFGDLQYGFFPKGSIPGHSSDYPSVGYDYESILLGLRLGRPNGFHWSLEAGPSHLNASTGNFQAVTGKSSSVTVGNPTVSGWIFPAVETGFSIVFP
jgi:hypothetical protein